MGLLRRYLAAAPFCGIDCDCGRQLIMRNISMPFGRAIAVQVVAAFIAGCLLSTAGFLLSPFVNPIPHPFESAAKSWVSDTHYHSDLSAVHMAAKHQSQEGHWLNIVCNLPRGILDVSVKLEKPIELTGQFDGRVLVAHRIGSGQFQSHWWSLNAKESLVFAPKDMSLAQHILRSKHFYFYGQFEPRGQPYIATFELTHVDDRPHPVIMVLSACEQPLMPVPATLPTSSVADQTMPLEKPNSPEASRAATQ